MEYSLISWLNIISSSNKIKFGISLLFLISFILFMEDFLLLLIFSLIEDLFSIIKFSKGILLLRFENILIFINIIILMNINKDIVILEIYILLYNSNILKTLLGVVTSLLYIILLPNDNKYIIIIKSLSTSLFKNCGCLLIFS